MLYPCGLITQIFYLSPPKKWTGTPSVSHWDALLQLNVTLWIIQSALWCLIFFSFKTWFAFFTDLHFNRLYLKWIILEILIPYWNTMKAMMMMMKMKEIQQHLFNQIIIQLQHHQVKKFQWWKWTREKRMGKKPLKHPSLKVLLLNWESSLQMRMHRTPLPKFILGQRLWNLRFLMVKEEGCRQRCLVRARQIHCRVKKGVQKSKGWIHHSQRNKHLTWPRVGGLIALKDNELRSCWSLFWRIRGLQMMRMKTKIWEKEQEKG